MYKVHNKMGTLYVCITTTMRFRNFGIFANNSRGCSLIFQGISHHQLKRDREWMQITECAQGHYDGSK